MYLSYFASSCIVWFSGQTCLTVKHKLSTEVFVLFSSFHLVFKGLQNQSSCQPHLHTCFRSPWFQGSMQPFSLGIWDKLMTWENLNYMWTRHTMLLIIENEASALSWHLISEWTLVLPFSFLAHLNLQNNALQLLWSPVHMKSPVAFVMTSVLLWLRGVIQGQAGGHTGVTAVTFNSRPTLLSSHSSG